MKHQAEPGYTDKKLLRGYDRLNPNYAEFLRRFGLDRRIVDARGAILTDTDGNEILDFVAGYGLFNLGHNPPALLEAMCKALRSSPLWGRPFLNEPLVELGRRLPELVPGDLDRMFVCSTGAETVDTALKLARLVTRRPGIVAAEGAFHGYTLGALSVCGIPSQRRPFEPLLQDVRHVPYGDAAALDEAVDDATAAVILEPIQAEIGAETPEAGYLEAARHICDRSGALLVIDEVRTGVGRTGTFVAADACDAVPDVLLLGKALAGGVVPIGAVLARPYLWGRFGFSFAMSASSFSGNRLAAVAALETLNILEREQLLSAMQKPMKKFQQGLAGLLAHHEGDLLRLTGRGFLWGLHFRTSTQAAKVMATCIHKGLLVATAFCNNRCILLEPPLVLSVDQVDRGLGILDDAISDAAKG